MTRNEFMKQMKEELMEMIPEDLRKGLTIEEITVVKSNDQKHHGLTFRREDNEAAPTLYLDDAYASFVRGADLHTLAAEMTDAYQNSLQMEQPQKVDFDMSNIEDKLTVRLLEIKRNRDYLAETPYMTVGHGLAMVCDIKMGDGRDGSWKATVTQSMLEAQKLDKRELFIAAMENAQKIDPPVLVDMSQALFGGENENLMLRKEPLDPGDVSNMFVLTNDSGALGAATLYYIKSGTIPKFSYVPSIVDWAKSHHQWQTRNYKPSPGDIIVIDWYANGTRDHVGIVESCDGRTVHTIEGNRTDQVGRGTYAVGSGTIFGYIVPRY